MSVYATHTREAAACRIEALGSQIGFFPSKKSYNQDYAGKRKCFRCSAELMDFLLEHSTGLNLARYNSHAGGRKEQHIFLEIGIGIHTEEILISLFVAGTKHVIQFRTFVGNAGLLLFRKKIV